MSTGLYHDHTEVPIWRVAGDAQAPKAGGDDTDEDEDKKELDHAEDAVQGAEAQNVQADEKKEADKIAKEAAEKKA